MKYLCNTIVLAIVISALTFRVQAQPETQKDVQGKKPSPEMSVPSLLPSEKEKRVKQEGTGKSDATKVGVPVSPTAEEKLTTAVTLAVSIGREANIDDPVDKIKIKLESAKLLVEVSPSNSRYLVAEVAELLLERKKKEQRESEQTKIVAIESEVVALYSKIDPEGTEKFISESLDIAAENIRKLHANNESLVAKARAEKMAELATALIDGSIPSGVDLLLNSVAVTGRVANAFSRPFRTVVSQPELRERMSSQIKQAFSGKIVAEPRELSTLAFPIIYITGKNDSCSTINATILELEINSLKQIETTLRYSREQGQAIPYANDELDYLCGLFASSLREQYSKWLPGRLKDVDLCLKGIQELVSFKIGARGGRGKAETFEEKLHKASDITVGSQRERELINLAFDVLNNRVSDERYSRDQMIDKLLNAFSSKDSKALVEDARLITGIKELVKEKNFLQVAREARRISRDDWRAQVIVGAASGLDKTDHDAAGLLYTEALDVLNNSKPGTAIIRTTLHIAERYYEIEPTVGRRILNSAVRFANQTNFSEKGFRFPFDRNLIASIGSIAIVLGFEPERIQDALRDFDIGKMAQSDWMMMYETSLNIENNMLRAIFQLKMCEAMISQSSRDARKTK